MDALERKYRRTGSFETGTFEEDLLVMHGETLETMVLNPTAAILWEALKWPQSVNDLTELLIEAFPQKKENILRTHVRELVEALFHRKLLIRV